jgi:hypothetical protein
LTALRLANFRLSLGLAEFRDDPCFGDAIAIAPFIASCGRTLEFLDISRLSLPTHPSRATAAMCKLLASLPALRTLVANQCFNVFSARVIHALVTHNTALEALHIQHCLRSAQCYKAFYRLSSLRSLRTLLMPAMDVLSPTEQPEFDPPAFDLVWPVHNHVYEALTHLDMSNNREIDRNFFRSLALLACSLCWLSVKNSLQFDDDALHWLVTLPLLESLDISECPRVSGTGLCDFATVATCLPYRLRVFVAQSMQGVREGGGIVMLVARAQQLHTLAVAHNVWTYDVEMLYALADAHHAALQHISLFMCELPRKVEIEYFMERLTKRRHTLGNGAVAPPPPLNIVLSRVSDYDCLHRPEMLSIALYSEPVMTLLDACTTSVAAAAVADKRTSVVCSASLAAPDEFDTADAMLLV